MTCVSNFHSLAGDATGKDRRGLAHNEKRDKIKERLRQFLAGERAPHDGLLFMKSMLKPILEKTMDYDALIQAFGDLNDGDITTLLMRCQSAPDQSMEKLKHQSQESIGQGHEISSDTSASNACKSATKLELATRLLLDTMIIQMPTTSYKGARVLGQEISNASKMNQSKSRMGEHRQRMLESLYRIAHPQIAMI